MKRKLNGKFLALVLGVILLLLSVYKVPKFISENKLSDLGYSKEAIQMINKYKIKKVILKNSYYSDYLEQQLKEKGFKKEYLELYLTRTDVDDKLIGLYDKLIQKKGYSKEEMNTLFQELSYEALFPLLIYDKVEDVQTYKKDCLDNNGKPQEDYLHPYENYSEVPDPSAVDVFVSMKSYLGEYVPENLVALNTMNSVPDVYLDQRAAEAFDELCAALRKEDAGIYAVGGYRSYEEQKARFSIYPTSIKEGFTDQQTGLGVFVVAGENESAADFAKTKAYKWLLNHAHEYGFLFRYPKEKDQITGYGEIDNYLRYVGEQLAGEIFDSGMCFDEYVAFYR